ncbi:MAG TPA: hypothetical protein VEH29_12820 [Acidimicrobiales bacterium]|nr:hypothetical protein [Acidimicrobiales bacterium]
MSTGALAGVAAALRGPDGPLTMVATADAIAAFRGVELALFSWLGRVAPACGSPAEVVWASSASLRAAWRATELETLLPVSAGLTATAGGEAGHGAAAGLASLVGEATSAESGVPAAVLSFYDVLLEAYRFRLERASPAADGPLQRVLERITGDLEAECNLVRGLVKAPGRGA